MKTKLTMSDLRNYVGMMVRHPRRDYDKRLLSVVWTLFIGTPNFQRNGHVLHTWPLDSVICGEYAQSQRRG